MQDIAVMVQERVSRRTMTRRAKREARDFYLLVLPWMLGFVGLSVIPLLLGLMTSFTNYNGLNLDTIKFVGINNFIRAFESKDFWIGLKNTVLYALVAVALGNIVALILALMLNRELKGRSIFRMLYYLPAILPLAGAVRSFSLIFNKNSGIVNAILSMIVPGTAVNWIVDYWVPVLIMFSLWGLGGAMVIYLAGLQGVPTELREAAKIDGANNIQVFFSVVLPLLTPVIFFQVVLGLIGSLQILDAAILLYGRAGLSGNITMPQKLYFYMVYNYSQVFDFQRYGYGVAISWIFFVMVLVLTMILLVTSRFWVYYEVAQEERKAA